MTYSVLFCSDSLIIDGVTSYILHVGTALAREGHRVAVLGRWAGKGFQKRFREEGIQVIQCPSPTVGNAWFDRQAARFAPDVLMTDSRRSFPLATRLKKRLGVPVVTYFLDHLEKTDRPGRDVASLVRWSDAWAGAEAPILETLAEHASGTPILRLPRPLDQAVRPTPLPPKDPFTITCFGRLSGYKTPGMFHLLEHVGELRDAVPSARVTLVGGGGWRLLKFRLMAAGINRRMGTPCVSVAGTQPDPRPWIHRSNLVCAASTSAIESVLSNRPTVCFASYWFGLGRPENQEEMVGCYFGERGGSAHFRRDPSSLERILPEIVSVYRRYDDPSFRSDTERLAQSLAGRFQAVDTAGCFDEIMRTVETGRP